MGTICGCGHCHSHGSSGLMDAGGFFRFVGDRAYREVFGDKLVRGVLDRGYLVSGRFFAGRTSCYARS